jgi:hypothetical protein
MAQSTAILTTIIITHKVYGKLNLKDMYTSARRELPVGKHACYGQPVPVTAVVCRCQGGLALYSMQLMVQLLYRDVSGSWHRKVHSYWYSCCTEMSVGHGTARYIVTGTAVVH